MAHPKARAGRFVHLPEHQHGLVEHPRSLYFAVQFLAFAAPLADPAEYAHAAVMTDHVVDHLHDQDRFTDACPAEQTALAPAFERRQNVDRLDAGFE